MNRLLVAIAFTATLTGAALANEHPSTREATYHGPLTAAEKSFVASAQADVGARFPTATSAEKAGYIRYTSEDSSGSISYANLAWQSTDFKHPSQLWYDKHGMLLGADYSRLKTDNTPPNIWGINPGRWWEFDRHIHYVTKDPATGKITYDSYLADDDWLAAGGSLSTPSAATLVAMHKVKDASDVVTVFSFPAVWDLMIWVRPNPNGPFAWNNPLVKP